LAFPGEAKTIGTTKTTLGGDCVIRAIKYGVSLLACFDSSKSNFVIKHYEIKNEKYSQSSPGIHQVINKQSRQQKCGCLAAYGFLNVPPAYKEIYLFEHTELAYQQSNTRAVFLRKQLKVKR
jgi:hypothetical protein